MHFFRKSLVNFYAHEKCNQNSYLLYWRSDFMYERYEKIKVFYRKYHRSKNLLLHKCKRNSKNVPWVFLHCIGKKIPFQFFFKSRLITSLFLQIPRPWGRRVGIQPTSISRWRSPRRFCRLWWSRRNGSRRSHRLKLGRSLRKLWRYELARRIVARHLCLWFWKTLCNSTTGYRYVYIK